MKTKWPPHWIYYASIAYISAKMRSSALMKAYLWSTNDGNASWTVDGHQGPWQGTKPASGKIANFSYYSYSRKIHSTTAQKGINGRKNQFEKTVYGLKLVFVS